MQILINHIGYEKNGPKEAVIMTADKGLGINTGSLICAKTHEVRGNYKIEEETRVANWHKGYFSTLDFSQFTQGGEFYLRVGSCVSPVFELGEGVLMRRTLSDLIHYFKSQRCSGAFDQKDREVSLYGSDLKVDVHGGWYDASGDVSKYLSHLSYANYLNPQQTPLVVWNMLRGLSLVGDNPSLHDFTRTRLLDEALYGADFLVRMQDDSGFFYTTVFDKWSKETGQREICSYATQNGDKSPDYQAGFRQGGGLAIAALARASMRENHGEFTQGEYLRRAEKGYQHLREHNYQYLDDGQENIIDDYCALLACVELLRASKNALYLSEARQWALRLCDKQTSDPRFENYWSVAIDNPRPYYHASDAGLPIIALCEYLDIEPDESRKKSIESTVESTMIFELTITQKVANPFGYPRQYVEDVDGNRRDQFFVPHNNESGYWWQGENARLASLAVAAMFAHKAIATPPLSHGIEKYAQHALNWITGLNPFDICMLDGHGRNNPDYLPDLGFFNAKGGICNGITSGFEDEEDIAFNPEEHKDDMLQNWRWGEQWIPHGAWYLLAIMTQAEFEHSRL